MKNAHFIIAIAILLVGFALNLSCTRKTDKKMDSAQDNLAEAAVDVKEAGQSEWQQFKADAETVISANEQVIADYKVKMKDANGKLKAGYDKKIDALEKQNSEMKIKLNEFKDDGKDAWKKFKVEFDSDMSELSTALKGFASSYKK